MVERQVLAWLIRTSRFELQNTQQLTAGDATVLVHVKGCKGTSQLLDQRRRVLAGQHALSCTRLAGQRVRCRLATDELVEESLLLPPLVEAPATCTRLGRRGLHTTRPIRLQAQARWDDGVQAAQRVRCVALTW